MALETFTRGAPNAQLRSERLQFHVFYAALMTFFVVMSALARLMPRRADARARLPIFDEARARTIKVVPLFFMG